MRLFQPLAIAAAAASGLSSAAWLASPWDTRSGAIARPRETGRRLKGDAFAGWTPKPTAAPGTDDGSLAVLELLKRGRGLDERDNTNTWLNSKTCGYYAGTSSEPYICDGASTCSTNQQNAVACVDGTDQPFFTMCFDFQAVQQGACNDAGPFTGCCFDKDAPDCATYVWEGQPIKSMYACFDQPTIFSMLDEPQFIHDSTAASSVSSSTTTTASSSSSSTAAAGSGSGSGGPNAGAIAGGVVGGLAVLSLALGAAVYFVRRSKKRGGGGPQTYNKLSSGDPSSSQPMVPLQSPQPSYPGGAASPYSLNGSFYDARQSYLYDPKQQYPGAYDPLQQPPAPPSELAAEAQPQGYAEMASNTPVGRSGAESKPYEMEGKL